MTYPITSDLIDGQFILDNSTRLQNRVMDYSEYKQRNNILPSQTNLYSKSKEVEDIYNRRKYTGMNLLISF